MKLFEIANEYCKQCNWKTLALVKFCLASIGIVIGMFIPEPEKKIVLVVCVIVFFVTYIPLMKKFFDICARKKD